MKKPVEPVVIEICARLLTVAFFFSLYKLYYLAFGGM